MSYYQDIKFKFSLKEQILWLLPKKHLKKHVFLEFI